MTTVTPAERRDGRGHRQRGDCHVQRGDERGDDQRQHVRAARRGGTPVAATVSYNATTRVATLTPSAALAGVDDLHGHGDGRRIRRQGRGRQRAGGDRDLVVHDRGRWRHHAADGDGDHARQRCDGREPSNSTVTATFSEAMDAGTINGTHVRAAQRRHALVAASVTYNAATHVATLTPSAALAGSTTYTATVTGGASGVKDVAGNALAANRDLVVHDRGSRRHHAAHHHCTLARDQRHGRQPHGQRHGHVQRGDECDDDQHDHVRAARSCRDHGGGSRFLQRDHPGGDAESDADAGLSDGLHRDGPGRCREWREGRCRERAGRDVSWTFTTVADTTAPTVSSTSPANGATTVSPTANVTATFNEAMDVNTINADTFAAA